MHIKKERHKEALAFSNANIYTNRHTHTKYPKNIDVCVCVCNPMQQLTNSEDDRMVVIIEILLEVVCMCECMCVCLDVCTSRVVVYVKEIKNATGMNNIAKKSTLTLAN